ncbi:MAG: DUF4302 domain-containing protein [Prevotella sp.]|nr:DUF4302 domain-containing protein [Prevotella sp.]
MIYKTISRTLLIALAATTVSCTFEQEDFFEDSASLRVTHTNEKIQQRLVEQSVEGQYGWVIQYFVAGTDEWNGPGFNLFGKFYDSGRVTLASNHQYLRNGNANKYTEANSTYEMLAEEGPVLSFNTWNDVLTVFEDPVDPTSAPSRLINDGEGMNGDHNLVLKALNDEDIIFRGERHSAQTRFVPCDRPWQDYIADTETMKKSITCGNVNSYYVVNEAADTLYFVDLRNGRFNFCERVNDPLSVKSLACVFTPQGFRLERENSFGDNTFQEFTIDAEKSKLLSEDGNTQVIPCWDNYILECSSNWGLDPDAFTAEQKELYAKMEAEVLKANSEFGLDSLAIGIKTETLSDGSQKKCPGLVAYVHGAPRGMGGRPTYTPYVYMYFGKTGFGQMQISAASETNITTDMESLFGTTELKSLCDQFAKTLYGSYAIKPNDYFRPTVAELVPAGGGNTIRLRLKKITD